MAKISSRMIKMFKGFQNDYILDIGEITELLLSFQSMINCDQIKGFFRSFRFRQIVIVGNGIAEIGTTLSTIPITTGFSIHFVHIF